MARGPSARGEQDLPASRIRVEPRLRRALGRRVATAPTEPPRASSRARRRLSGGPRRRGCPRLDRARASPGSGRRRARRHGCRRRAAPPRLVPGSARPAAATKVDGTAGQHPGEAPHHEILEVSDHRLGEREVHARVPGANPGATAAMISTTDSGRSAVSEDVEDLPARGASANDSLSSRNAATPARPSTTG